MKKILVPTDLSDVANNALDVAVNIARYTDASIDLLNVKLSPSATIGTYYSLYGSTGLSFDDAWDDILIESKKDMQHLIDKYVGIEINAIVEETGSNFLKKILEHDADLIVMGSNGADGIKEFFMNSNSGEIVRLANCPVLVIKGKVDYFAPKTVVLAVDFAHAAYIKEALAHLPVEGADFHFLHVDTGMKKINYEESKKAMHEMADLLDINSASFNIEDAAIVEQGILSYSEKVNADLIVMYTHGRKGIGHFFIGSVAEHVVNHADIPVFTFVQH